MPPAKKPAKKAAAKKAPPAQEATGPSSEPVKPVLTLNSTTGAAAANVGLWGISGGFLVQGLLVFGVQLTEAQAAWLTGALTIAVGIAQNWVESRRGRRLIGAPA
jgi:hypothetical protein